jgi:hypothetical protein
MSRRSNQLTGFPTVARCLLDPDCIRERSVDFVNHVIPVACNQVPIQKQGEQHGYE